MSVQNILFRLSFGTIGAPANQDNKQMAVNIGVDAVSGNDVTEIIVKDIAGTNHVFITKVNVLDMINQNISIASNVWVVPLDDADFIDLLELDEEIKIWPNGLDLTGGSSYVPNIVSNKIIGGVSNESLIFGNANFSFRWPSSGADNISVDFYIDINDTVGNISHQGGFSGSPEYRVRFKSLRFPVSNSTVGGTDVKTLFESNRGTASTIEGVTQFLELWSGQNTFGLRNSSTAIIKTDPAVNTQVLALGDESGFTTAVETDSSAGTVGVVTNRLTANHGLNKLAQLGYRTSDTGILRAWQFQINAVDVLNVDEEGHVGIKTLPFDWGSSYVSTDEGPTGSSATHTDGTKLHGNNFYHNGTNLIFKVASEANWTEMTVGGVIITYKNDNTPSALGTITPRELSRVDADGNRSYNGATIETGLDSTYNYVFKNDSCVFNHTTNETVFVCGNCYLLSGGTFNFMDDTRDATITLTSNGIESKYIIPSSVGDGFTYSNYETGRNDENGNRSYNGATIPASLHADYNYTFYEESCVFYKISTGSGTVYNAVNVYLDGSLVWKSMANTSLKCSFTALSISAFLIRQSTATSTAVGQTMTMTTVITPT